MEDLRSKLERLAIGSDALDELHTKKLKALLTRVYDESPHYKEKFDKAGVNPHKFSSLDEFKNYPTFDKYEERESQARSLSELGHPLGMTGTRLILTLLLELRRRGARYGVASACIGGGQGIAVAVEADK